MRTFTPSSDAAAAVDGRRKDHGLDDGGHRSPQQKAKAEARVLRGSAAPLETATWASRLQRQSLSEFSAKSARAFTLLETLLALALVALMLLALNAFIFSMGELWGRGTDKRLFDQHVRAVTRFLEHELRNAALPPAARSGRAAITPQEIRLRSGNPEILLTFELPAGSRLLSWPDRPLPDVVCSLQAREAGGLVLHWHSRLETRFADDPPRESVISPLVSGLTYDYYNTDFKRWTTETALKKGANGEVETPQRLRLKFTYGTLTRESIITLPSFSEGLPGA